MSTRLITLNPVSTIAGSATPVTAAVLSIFASSVIMEASLTNTGSVYVGDSGVTSTNGTTLKPGVQMEMHFDLTYGANGKIDLSTIYFASDTTNNTVRISYLRWDGG